MNSLRSNSVPFLLVGLILVSLRPVGLVDRLLDLAFAPTRLVVELVAPLRWIESARYAKADQALLETRDLEGRAGSDLALDLRAAAEPKTPVLRLGRQLVPGLVVGRPKDNLDTIWLQLDSRQDTRGIPLSAPVVLGEAYVGRVVELVPKESRVRVDLVAGREFYVGGQLAGDAELRLTVGGLHGTGELTRLAVHNPSERRFRPGQVRVLEPELLTTSVAHLADGYLLGELHEELEGLWSVAPVVDFKSGLFQLMVLVPPDGTRDLEPAPIASLADGGWRASSPLSVGDSLHGRRTLRIHGGSLSGIERGAAVVATTRLVGRVDRAHPVAPLSARVRLIGDPGLELHVMARLDEDHSARVLGLFVGLGLDPAGVPLFEWEPPIGLGGGEREDESYEATLYTGSGLPGLPEGLYLGTATLPSASGTHVIRLRDFADGLDHRALWVRAEPVKGSSP
ncbi:MAG: hypothetical protein H8D72_01580 [Planctomycetes bacterium]|nr:hypothetical protein [Planctomycetota bacterium]